RPFKAKIGFKDPIHQAIVAKKLGLDSHKISENRNPFHFAEVSNLKADLLLEGHFGIFETKQEV
ncbi:MAG: hypothetical protein ACLP5H_27850, partial [Desulfomonilaceae bacterium]